MTIRIILTFWLLPLVPSAQSDIAGKWSTLDETGKQTSIVEIFERKGKIYGKILEIFPEPGDARDPVCEKCDKADPRYRKKVIGMEIILELVKQGDNYSGGTILDPKNGKVYDCTIWIDKGDLKVRGYLGPFYRTQTWKKVH